jgi:hypothetical protein
MANHFQRHVVNFFRLLFVIFLCSSITTVITHRSFVLNARGLDQLLLITQMLATVLRVPRESVYYKTVVVHTWSDGRSFGSSPGDFLTVTKEVQILDPILLKG